VLCNLAGGTFPGEDVMAAKNPRKRGKAIQPEDVPKMAAMYAEGWGWGIIGERFGTSGTAVSKRVRTYERQSAL
jgi:hypothetical protein